MQNKFNIIFFSYSLILSLASLAQEIPSSQGYLYTKEKGVVYFEGRPELEIASKYTLSQFSSVPSAIENGLKFDFNSPNFNGFLMYGFIPYGDGKHPLPVYFKRKSEIKNGITEIDILALSGKYDMVSWEKSGGGTLGYRIENHEGLLIYDGKIRFGYYDGKFQVHPTIVEGPFINQLTSESVVISFLSNLDTDAKVIVNDKTHSSNKNAKRFEFFIDGLSAESSYTYSVIVNNDTQSYQFTTPTKSASSSGFTFAYASDSRNGQGGGERNVYGVNFYIMKKILALATQQKAAFFQFTGDLIDGYLTSVDETNLQYANWKRAVEPFWHYMPIYAGMGNHEALMRVFKNEEGKKFGIDRFPYETESAETIFAQNFCNFRNGPESEVSSTNKKKNKTDFQVWAFPSYYENVYSYQHENVAMIVLNSNYWYAPSLEKFPKSNGNLHGYIMDVQLNWLKTTVQQFENNPLIDHIFVTVHTPFFPNGGHVQDDMWYNGNNTPRPFVNGKPAKKGIIERRDELLDILVNQSTKVAALLTGDEHNYARTEIGAQTPIYPENWSLPKIELKRSIIQINNGAAGAPYYAQEITPWSTFCQGFTTQNALVLIDIKGKSIKARVINPDTLEEFDSFVVRE